MRRRRRSQCDRSTTKATPSFSRRSLLRWRTVLAATIAVALTGIFVTSRQFLLQLSSSSPFMAGDSHETEHAPPAVETPPAFVEDAPPVVEATGFVGMRSKSNNKSTELQGSQEDTTTPATSYNKSNSNNNTELQVPQHHPVSSQQAPENHLPSTKTIALWCFLDDKSTYIFPHFPHALQALSQCWSFFQSQQAQLQATASSQLLSNDDTFQCHINLNRVGRLGQVKRDWRAALIVKLMKCTYDYKEFNLSQLPQNSTVISLIKRPADQPQDQKQQPKGKKHTKPKPELPRNNATHTYYLFRPHRNDAAYYRFFWDPQHGQVLRNRLFETKSYRNHNNISKTTNSSSNSVVLMDETVLRIGLVNRLGNRKVGNMDQLQKAIQRMYPDCIVERANMEGMTPLQQFTWWSRQSIVILPHGAGSTNLVFLKAGSAIIEIFPPHYYWRGFWALSKTLNGHYYGYFPLMATTGNTSRSERNDLVMEMYAEFKQSCKQLDAYRILRSVPVISNNNKLLFH